MIEISKGYCPKCNLHIHKRKKGEWKPVEMRDEEIVIIKTKRGPKKFIKGTCPDCGSKMSLIIGD